ncbi:MAG: hypothetical protein QOH50_5056 [Kribbellaceae bacterium]|nr:hypothetical protein [Kribbellaceae bacterium]
MAAETAELWNRFREMELNQHRLGQRMENLAVENSRMRDNQETETKLILQKMLSMDGELTGNRDRLERVEKKVDQVAESNERISGVMEMLVEKLAQMPRDMQNMVDTWGTIRFGGVRSTPDTVSGSELKDMVSQWHRGTISSRSSGLNSIPMPAPPIPTPNPRTDTSSPTTTDFNLLVNMPPSSQPVPGANSVEEMLDYTNPWNTSMDHQDMNVTEYLDQTQAGNSQGSVVGSTTPLHPAPAMIPPIPLQSDGAPLLLPSPSITSAHSGLMPANSGLMPSDSGLMPSDSGVNPHTPPMPTGSNIMPSDSGVNPLIPPMPTGSDLPTPEIIQDDQADVSMESAEAPAVPPPLPVEFTPSAEALSTVPAPVPVIPNPVPAAPIPIPEIPAISPIAPTIPSDPDVTPPILDRTQGTGTSQDIEMSSPVLHSVPPIHVQDATPVRSTIMLRIPHPPNRRSRSPSLFSGGPVTRSRSGSRPPPDFEHSGATKPVKSPSKKKK